MLTSTISRNDQRTVIAKLRKVAEAKPGFTFQHDRVRKTKSTAESNTYSLIEATGAPVVTVKTNEATVTWPENIKSHL